MNIQRLSGFALVVSVLLAGCASGSGGELAGSSGSQGESTTEAPEADDAEGADGGTSAPQTSDLVSVAQSEGAVTWYTALPEGIVTAAAEAFEAEHGIAVEWVRLLSGEMSARYAGEREAGAVQVDVITMADPTFLASAAEEGWLVELQAEEIPALTDWPEEAVRDGHQILTNVQSAAFAYNTDLVSTPPESWEDLLDEEFAGKIVMADPRPVGAQMATLNFLREHLGEDAYAQLGAQGVTFLESSVAGTQSVVAGENLVAMSTVAAIVDPLKADGAPVELVIPDATTGFENWSVLSTDSPHPAAGRLFLDFLMSEDAQAIVNADVASSPLPDVPGTLPLPDDYTSPDVIGAFEDQEELITPFGLDLQ